MEKVIEFMKVYTYTTFTAGFILGGFYGYTKTAKKIHKQKYDDFNEITTINLLTMNMLKYGCQGGLMFVFLPFTIPLYCHIYSSKFGRKK